MIELLVDTSMYRHINKIEVYMVVPAAKCFIK